MEGQEEAEAEAVLMGWRLWLGKKLIGDCAHVYRNDHELVRALASLDRDLGWWKKNANGWSSESNKLSKELSACEMELRILRAENHDLLTSIARLRVEMYGAEEPDGG